jgi:hypothetical protein
MRVNCTYTKSHKIISHNYGQLSLLIQSYSWLLSRCLGVVPPSSDFLLTRLMPSNIPAWVTLLKEYTVSNKNVDIKFSAHFLK